MPPRRRDRFGVLVNRSSVDVSPGTRYWNARVFNGQVEVRRAGGFDSADRLRRGNFGGSIVTGATSEDATAAAHRVLGVSAPRSSSTAAGRSSGS